MILCLMVAKLATLVDFRENIIPNAFLGHKVKITLLVFISASSAQYSLNHLLDYNYLSWCSGCLREWIVHRIYATLVNFSNISCFLCKQILFYLVQIEKNLNEIFYCPYIEKENPLSYLLITVLKRAVYHCYCISALQNACMTIQNMVGL